MSCCILSGINFFHNIVQEDVLREHKRLLDSLRREEAFDPTDLIGNIFYQQINIFALQNKVRAFSFTNILLLQARIVNLEQRMDNTAESFDFICNSIEKGTGATATHCCVNGDNNKMYCLDGTLLAPTFNIDTGTVGECDRRAFGIPPVTNVCSDTFP